MDNAPAPNVRPQLSHDAIYTKPQRVVRLAHMAQKAGRACLAGALAGDDADRVASLAWREERALRLLALAKIRCGMVA